MSKIDENLSYREAMLQLEKILSDMEEGKIEIDAMAEIIDHAKALAKFCEDRLKVVEEKLSD